VIDLDRLRELADDPLRAQGMADRQAVDDAVYYIEQLTAAARALLTGVESTGYTGDTTAEQAALRAVLDWGPS
jgi:hypothetical protein